MRKTRRKKIGKTSLNTAHSITLYHQRIPKDRFAALSDDDKYCFLVLGHIHDEISWLQRMAYVASRYRSNRSNVESSAQMMQATFLARLLLGKLFEFDVLLNKNRVLQDFIASYFELSDSLVGKAKLKDIADAFEQNAWIRTARNKHFLHYPSRSDANEILTGGLVDWEVEVFHGKLSSNTFYPTSDVMANLAWFRLVEPEDPIKGLDIALQKIRDIAQLSLESLEVSIGHFINEKLMKLSNHKEISISVSETIDSFKLHYFLKT